MKLEIHWNKTMSNERLSILQWETLAAEVANSINYLPLALGSITSDFESMDLITPNYLRLGRNNDRSPIGSLKQSFQDIGHQQPNLSIMGRALLGFACCETSTTIEVVQVQSAFEKR